MLDLTSKRKINLIRILIKNDWDKTRILILIKAVISWVCTAIIVCTELWSEYLWTSFVSMGTAFLGAFYIYAYISAQHRQNLCIAFLYYNSDFLIENDDLVRMITEKPLLSPSEVRQLPEYKKHKRHLIIYLAIACVCFAIYLYMIFTKVSDDILAWIGVPLFFVLIFDLIGVRNRRLHMKRQRESGNMYEDKWEFSVGSQNQSLLVNDENLFVMFDESNKMKNIVNNRSQAKSEIEAIRKERHEKTKEEGKAKREAMHEANHQCNSCARRVGCTVVGRPNCASYIPKKY